MDMNIYNYSFPVTCPNDGELIIYDLTIESKKKIMVEHIVSSCKMIKNKHHEDIADILSSQFDGKHTMTATHQGVLITTNRSNLYLVTTFTEKLLCTMKEGALFTKAPSPQLVDENHVISSEQI